MNVNMKNLKKTETKETKKLKKLLNEEIRLGIHESDSDTEEVDLSKELHPLGHYVNKREEMVEQMFSIVSGRSLKKLLPPIIKDMDIGELKAECLIHLLGQEIDSSSESETHSEGSPPYGKKIHGNISTFPIKQEGCSDISDTEEFVKSGESSGIEIKIDDSDIDVFLKGGEAEKNKKPKRKKRKSGHEDSRKKKQTKVDCNKSESVSISKDISEEKNNLKGTQGKTLLEILELEMRAKAIRALLKDGGEVKSNNSDKEDGTEKNKSMETNQKRRRSSSEEVIIQSDSELVTIDLTDDGEAEKNKKPKRKKRKSGHEDSRKKKQTKVDCNKSESVSISKDISEEKNNLKGTQGKTLLEILELEMRAKAIRALLKDGGEVKSNNSDKEDGTEKNNKSMETNQKRRRSSSEEVIIQSDSELVTIDLTDDGDLKRIETEEDKTETIVVSNTSNMVDNVDLVSSSCEKANEKLSTNESGDTLPLLKEDAEKSSWAERWLQSKDVSKVISTSKMCANIRKRMRDAKLAKKNGSVSQTSERVGSDSKSVEGSVSEYQLLTISQKESEIVSQNTGEIVSQNISEIVSQDNSNCSDKDSSSDNQTSAATIESECFASDPLVVQTDNAILNEEIVSIVSCDDIN
uniref:Caspase activity and apoptosis inhibitor 1 n=1 Tax=Clastoptera arizonana TaxID=38151 RepID=A0A1B6D365_9HEMI